MEKIKLLFVDMWKDFDQKNNYFYNILSRKYSIEISETPDYLIYSCFGYEFLKYDCIRIFFTGENIIPDFNLCDYAIGFADLSFNDRYIRHPLFTQFTTEFLLAQNKHNNYVEAQNRIKFCNFIYSNHRKADPYRDEFFHKLNKYKKVESGGKHLNNIGFRVDDKVNYQRDFKFSIAFENSYCPGYTTEKIIHAFAAQTIPVYWGNPDIGKDFNVRSFINCHDYASIDSVIEKVIEIDRDDKLFKEYMDQPIFLDANIPEKFTDNYLILFFSRIFEQGKVRAIRRTRYGWNYKYEQTLLKKMKKKPSALKKMIKFIEKL